jgi:hypothetical protein
MNETCTVHRGDKHRKYEDCKGKERRQCAKCKLHKEIEWRGLEREGSYGTKLN